MKTLSCLSYPEDLMLALVYVTQMLQETIIESDVPRITAEKNKHKFLGSRCISSNCFEIGMDF